MARLIDAEKLKDHLDATKDVIMSTQNDVLSASAKGAAIGVCQAILEVVDAQPTIDAQTVRHGQWINDTFCSECNRFPVDVSFNVSNQKLAKYFSWCPHCGAKMDGGAENG